MNRPLSYKQRLMLRCSGCDIRDGTGYGVELEGAGMWATARSLVARGLGRIHDGRSAPLPGLFFANRDGIEAVADGGPN